MPGPISKRQSMPTMQRRSSLKASKLNMTPLPATSSATSSSSTKTFQDGELIFEQGDIGTDAYKIVTGSVRVLGK